MNKKQKEAFDKDPEGFVTELLGQIENLKSDHSAELEALIETHKDEVASLQTETAKVLNVVPGKFKSNDGRQYKFKKGFVKTRTRKGEIVDSADLISKKEFAEEMEHLIKIGYGGLELVTK